MSGGAGEREGRVGEGEERGEGRERVREDIGKFAIDSLQSNYRYV